MLSAFFAGSSALCGVRDSTSLAAALRVHNQASQWQEALELFAAQKIAADRSAYTEDIVAHGRLRQSDKALDVFRGRRPDADRRFMCPRKCISQRPPVSAHAALTRQIRQRFPRAGARATGRLRSRSFCFFSCFKQHFIVLRFSP